jgi:hypothetical protein
MGAMNPVEPTWSTAQALESLLLLMRKHGMDGGCFWRWTNFDNSEDSDSSLAQPIKRRGTIFTYNPVKDDLLRYYTTP